MTTENKPAETKDVVTDQVSATENEVQSTAPTQQTPNANPTRREQRQQRHQKNRENAAPEGLFTRNKEKLESLENPQRVTIVKQHLAAYVADSGKGAGEGQEAQLASKSLKLAVSNLLTLRGESLREAHAAMLKSIKDHPGSYELPYPYMYPERFKSPTERNVFSQYMNLVLTYAKLDNKSAIHSRVDLVSATKSMNPAVAKELIALFPNK